LLGQVWNDGTGVVIHVWGKADTLAHFLSRLREEAPRLARIDAINQIEISYTLPPRQFSIAESVANIAQTSVAPDASPCDDCLQEIGDINNRRYLYPFTNCIHCGPRFSITQKIPFDRERTTMSRFTMCVDCQREYDDPCNRRFHAQTNACPQCGPQMELLDSNGKRLQTENPFSQAANCIIAGGIVAVKGVGGYQLACSAVQDDAVVALRSRKHRWDKPFAVMVKDLNAVREICWFNADEEALLTSPMAPIVLLRRQEQSSTSDQVAPGQGTLGVMLPSSPLHTLLLEEVGEILVMTSGNLSDEPIVYQDEDAINRLGGIADYFLIHNRPIQMRLDDSVTRVVAGRTLLVRRSRGYAPGPVMLSGKLSKPILACGGHLKNTFCLAKDRNATVSPHLGDLENYESLTAFQEGIEHYQNLLDIKPQVVAYDLHPDYLSTQFAQKFQAEIKIPVQHHHAHIASVMLDQGMNNETVIGVAFDGAGYGTDGTFWGGEFFLGNYRRFDRVAHLQYTPLPGGVAAIREPWRNACALLHQTYGKEMERLNIEFMQRLDGTRWKILKQMIQRKQNCPLSSSMGRLFDGVASLLGIRDTVSYEGQAAMELEQMADEQCLESYSWQEISGTLPSVIGLQSLMHAIVEDILAGASRSLIASRFHNSVAEMVTTVCGRLRQSTGVEQVVLGGGVFQNKILLRRLIPLLEGKCFQVYLPQSVPVNDGGISLGQMAIANALLK
jgi:hydrogenase maturation protein HypF